MSMTILTSAQVADLPYFVAWYARRTPETRLLQVDYYARQREVAERAQAIQARLRTEEALADEQERAADQGEVPSVRDTTRNRS